MNSYKIIICLSILFLLNLNYRCQTKTGTLPKKTGVISVPVDESETLTRIAIGSCNRSDLRQPLWQTIVEQKPDLWIWLGDNIYGDTEDMDKLAANYQRQKNNIEYQILPTQHNYEKWNTFPQERKKLFGLLSQYKVPGVILMSGDRHIGELSKTEIAGLDYPLVELTTSGLTHVYENASEANNLRVGSLVNQLNFGFLK